MWAREEYWFPILYKGENIGRMEMYLCLPLHTTHSDTEFWSSLIYIQIIAYVKSNDKYTVCWMKWIM